MNWRIVENRVCFGTCLEGLRKRTKILSGFSVPRSRFELDTWNIQATLFGVITMLYDGRNEMHRPQGQTESLAEKEASGSAGNRSSIVERHRLLKFSIRCWPLYWLSLRGFTVDDNLWIHYPDGYQMSRAYSGSSSVTTSVYCCTLLTVRRITITRDRYRCHKKVVHTSRFDRECLWNEWAAFDMNLSWWIRIVEKLRFNWQWETGKHIFLTP